MGDYEGLSNQDLIEIIQEFEDEIKGLNRDLELARRKKGGKDSDVSNALELADLTAENDELREIQVRSQEEIDALKIQISESAAKYRRLEEEKLDAEAKVKASARRIDALEKEVLDVTNKSRSTELQSKEADKQKTATIKETRRLFEENDQLREENKKMAEILRANEENISLMEALIAKQAEEKDHLELHRDTHLLEKEDLHSSVSYLEQRIQEMQDELRLAHDANEEVKIRTETLQVDHKAAMEAAAKELKVAKGEIANLKKEIISLKDSTLVGEKQRELDRVKAEHKEILHLLKTMESELEIAVADREQLARRMLENDAAVDLRVAERVVAEREQTVKLQQSLFTLTQRKEEESEKVHLLEEEKRGLVREIDELINWKAVYESGHGLQELARNQKKLKDDNRRLGVAVEQMTNKLGMAMDVNGILSHAFDKLKKECGKSDDFMYDEYVLQEEMMGDNARLKAQSVQLEEQISALEEENIRLRKSLKNQAGSLGEQGFKFAGMTSDHLVKVNEFAANLRDNRIELPVSDRTNELLKENKGLKEDIHSLKQRIERMEADGVMGAGSAGMNLQLQHQQLAELISTAGGNKGGGTGLSRLQEAELFGLREDVQRLLHENADLHDRMTQMQSEFMAYVKKRISHPSDASVGQGQAANIDDIAALLLANNEALMKEVQELRSGAHAQSSMGPVDAPEPAPPNAYQQLYQQHGSHTEQPGFGLPPSGRGTRQGQGGFGTPLATGKSRAGFSVGGFGASMGFTTPRQQGWTPMGSSGMGMGMGAGLGVFGAQNQSFAMPATPHGKQLLTRNLNALNLPPEEWAVEVRDLNGQLIECLEQLYEREQELEEQQAMIGGLEDALVSTKQQLAALYYDFAQRSSAWETREKSYKQESVTMHNARDDLQLRLRRTQEVIDVLQKEDSDSTEAKLTEMMRKVIVYEVNEAMLARKFMSQSEQLQQEQETRARLETDFAEMESTLKKRILFLEQYKASISTRLGHVQGKLDISVPQEDYKALQAEIENLREEHLTALRREVEVRVEVLKAQDQSREIRALKVSRAHSEAELSAARGAAQDLVVQLEHQKEATARALVAAKSSAELSEFVSEMARFRGEASRLEVELLASNRRAELLVEEVKQISREADEYAERVRELEAREAEAGKRESDARKAALELQLMFDGGLSRQDADTLRQTVESIRRDLEESRREATRHRELAEIASLQAQTLGGFRAQRDEELNDLREYCNKLESKGDDELLIGRLQRQLMSTKTSYKAFVRKYQLLRGNMRQRELALRVLETRLDQREEAVLSIQDSHRLEVSALKKALRVVSDLTVENINLALSFAADDKKLKPGEKSNIKIKERSRSPRVDVGGEGKRSSGLVPMSLKLSQLTEKVNHLATMAETSSREAAESSEKARALAATVEDLNAEKEILLNRCNDLESLANSKGKQGAVATKLVSMSEDVRLNKLLTLQQKRQIAVLRQEKQHLQNIIAGMEVDVEDLEQGKVMAETKNLLGGLSDEAGGPKDGQSAKTAQRRVAVDTDETVDQYKQMRGDLLNLGKGSGNGRHDDGDGDGDGDGPSLSARKSVQFAKKSSLKIHTEGDLPNDTVSASGDRDMIDSQIAHDLMGRVKSLTDELSATRRDASMHKMQHDRVFAQCAELEAILNERDDQLAYCERVMAERGLPSIVGREDRNEVPQARDGRQYRLMRDEQEKLQAAASATIGSLRALLDEKSRQLERYREKIEELQAEKRPKSRADIQADQLLDELERDDQGRGKRAHRMATEVAPVKHLDHSDLLERLNQADELLMDKANTISQLEQKLAANINQRERAEARCGAALQEMESMKLDMTTLVRQLQAAESKYQEMLSYAQATHKGPHTPHIPHPPTPAATTSHMAEPMLMFDTGPFEKKIAELQKVGKVKDEKIKGYRDIIIKLKEEFVKSEEQQALANVNAAAAKAGASGGGGVMMDAEAVKDLRGQIAALRDGLRQSKEDLEKARKQREKLLQAKQAAQEEAERIGSQLGRAEAQAAAAQDALQRARKELEDTRRKEVKLREKLKELMENETDVVLQQNLRIAQDQAAQLQRELDVVRAQNIALRIAVEDGTDLAAPSRTSHMGESSRGAPEEKSKLEAESASASGPKMSRGRTLNEGLGEGRGAVGSGPGATSGPEIGPLGDYREQMHMKWEAEKKAQKRIVVLEKRLQEKMEENEDLQTQLKRARDLATSAAHAKDEMQKKATAASRFTHEARKLTVEDLANIDEVQGRIFAIQEENAALRRRAEVELPTEITSLRHQLKVSRQREQELMEGIEEGEMFRKRMAASAGGGGGGRSLRDSEDQFMREERLRDELEKARRQRVELEAGLLDRDARALEYRFDMEAKADEADRLRRRVSELEAAYRTATAAVAGTAERGDTGQAKMPGRQVWGPETTGQKAGAGKNTSKREEELEGVIETMKRIVEKLKGENERLKRGGGGGVHDEDRRLLEMEKKAASERKRAERLDAELKALQAKVKPLEDNSQKLVQRQQMVAGLRKQLKAREDDAAALRQAISSAEEERDLWRKKAASAEGRAEQLDSQLQQAARLGAGNRGAEQRLDQLQVEITDLKRRTTDLAVENEGLRSQLAEAHAAVTAAKASRQPLMKAGVASGGSGGGGGGGDAVELRQLREENEKLKRELSAFDLDFFEEIENLKYAHAEAVRKLRMYEGASGR